MKRVVTVVIDSGGVGAMDDADIYGDAPGANTIGNVARRLGSLHLPHLERLGLGLLTSIPGVAAVSDPRARVARLRERSRGKDTITGHWEMMGITTSVPFPTYPNGFPADVVEAFAQISRQAAARKHPGLGDRDHRRARCRPRGIRAAHPLYFGRLGLSNRRARRRGTVESALRLEREGA